MYHKISIQLFQANSYAKLPACALNSRIKLSNATNAYFLCPNLGTFRGRVMKTKNTDKIAAMVNVALSDEA